jgi:predicted RNase H-like HicB family nuclease
LTNKKGKATPSQQRARREYLKMTGHKFDPERIAKIRSQWENELISKAEKKVVKRGRQQVAKSALDEVIVYIRSVAWWIAELPAFPGAYTQGRTKREAYLMLLSGIRDLVDAYIDQAAKKRH